MYQALLFPPPREARASPYAGKRGTGDEARSAPAKTGPIAIIMRTNEAPPSYCSCIAIQAAMDSSDVGDLTAEVYQYLTEGKQKLIVRYLS